MKRTQQFHSKESVTLFSHVPSFICITNKEEVVLLLDSPFSNVPTYS